MEKIRTTQMLRRNYIVNCLHTELKFLTEFYSKIKTKKAKKMKRCLGCIDHELIQNYADEYIHLKLDQHKVMLTEY